MSKKHSNSNGFDNHDVGTAKQHESPQDRRAITLGRIPESAPYSTAPASEEDIKEIFELENYWPRTKDGDQLFTLGLRLSVTTDWSGYNFPGPIPPEVAKWVLENLPKGMVEQS
jgi:hypothetical protein